VQAFLAVCDKAARCEEVPFRGECKVEIEDTCRDKAGYVDCLPTCTTLSCPEFETCLEACRTDLCS
jgi:hypothetical protein